MMAKPIGDTAVLELLGENVARARGKRTQGELAKLSGIDISTISDLENGRRNPSVTTIAKLASVLGVEVADLFRSGATPAAGLPAELEARLTALERGLLSTTKVARKALALVEQPPSRRSSGRPPR